MLVSVISRPILETIIVNDTAADIDVLCRGFIVDPYSHIMNNQPYRVAAVPRNNNPGGLAGGPQPPNNLLISILRTVLAGTGGPRLRNTFCRRPPNRQLQLLRLGPWHRQAPFLRRPTKSSADPG